MTKQTRINAILFLTYGAVLYGFYFLLGNTLNGYALGGINLSVFLVFGSVGLGMAGQFIFDWNNQRPFREVLKASHLTVILLMVGLIIIQFETVICIVMGWPIIYLGLLAGLYTTRALLDLIDNKTTFCIPLLLLPFAPAFMDVSVFIPTKTYTVSTQIEMQGTPDQVRALTLSVPLIDDAERPWTLTHSVLRAPRPLAATVKNGVRYATWERGVAFEEILIPSDTPNQLSWTFNFPDPALLKPLDYRISPIGPEVVMQTGGYQFDAISPNRTLVTLTTSYQLHTVMNGYFAFWGEVFLDDFHMAVLHVLAQRAEATL